jgi:hypothetical protein
VRSDKHCRCVGRAKRNRGDERNQARNDNHKEETFHSLSRRAALMRFWLMLILKEPASKERALRSDRPIQVAAFELRVSTLEVLKSAAALGNFRREFMFLLVADDRTALSGASHSPVGLSLITDWSSTAMLRSWARLSRRSLPRSALTLERQSAPAGVGISGRLASDYALLMKGKHAFGWIAYAEASSVRKRQARALKLKQ